MFGAWLAQTIDRAQGAAKEKAQQLIQSAVAGSEAVGQKLHERAEQAQVVAREKTAELISSARAGAQAINQKVQQTADRAVAVGEAAVQKGDAALVATGRVAVFGADAAFEAAMAGSKAALSPYATAKRLFYGTGAPARRASIEQCPTEVAKRERLHRRLRLIESGRQSPVPNIQNAARSLAQNNEAVELARLSSNSYDQYKFPDPPAPAGWRKLRDNEMSEGTAALLRDSKAVVYQTPADWPGGAKTVVSFRGTDGKEDLIEDYNQAMNQDAVQYRAARRLANSIKAEPWGQDVLVTGHSLGGGKAQAFAGAGGAKGMAFNAAGLHPGTSDEPPYDDQIIQYRTEGDPLTGIQNSSALQLLVQQVAGAVSAGAGYASIAVANAARTLGISDANGLRHFGKEALLTLPRSIRNLIANGSVIPPAIGRVHEVPAVADSGAHLALLNPLGQHSIDSVINGIEEQKTEDVLLLEAA